MRWRATLLLRLLACPVHRLEIQVLMVSMMLVALVLPENLGRLLMFVSLPS